MKPHVVLALMTLVFVRSVGIVADENARASVRASIQGPQGRRKIPNDAAQSLIAPVEKLFASCSFDSLDSSLPVDIFTKLRPLEGTWERYLKRPHLYAHISPAARANLSRGARVAISEVLIPIGDPGGPDYWLTRDSGAIVIYTKCSCEGTTAVICAPAILPDLPTEGRQYCAAYEELRRRAAPSGTLSPPSQ